MGAVGLRLQALPEAESLHGGTDAVSVAPDGRGDDGGSLFETAAAGVMAVVSPDGFPIVWGPAAVEGLPGHHPVPVVTAVTVLLLLSRQAAAPERAHCMTNYSVLRFIIPLYICAYLSP